MKIHCQRLLALLAAVVYFQPLTCLGLSTPSPNTFETASKANGVASSASKIGSTPLTQNQKALDQVPRFPRTWVPLAAVTELDPDRPTPVSFMDQNYIIYKGNSDQEWVVMDDACAHRLAPLSEGRIETVEATGERRLMCSYHGWQFDSAGQCKHIPQATDQVQEKAFQDPRCRIKSYTTIVENNIVFTWPWKEDPIEMTMENPSATPESMMEGVSTVVASYTRDLPYGWDTLVENLIDPAHVPFAHHNLQGTRDDAVPITMTAPSSVSESGFSLEFTDRTMGLDRNGTANFKAPYVLTYDGEYQTSGPLRKFFNLTTVCIPTKPGWSRVMVLVTLPNSNQADNQSDDESSSKPPSFMSKLIKLVPVWIIHQLSNRFLDSDLAFLHYQEQERERRGGDLSDKDDDDMYFTPAQADRAVNAFRRWKYKYASVLLPLPPPITSRAVLFDRYTQHTSHCKHCSEALENVKKIRVQAVGATALGVALAATQFPVMGSVLVAASLGLLLLLQLAEENLMTADFKHYENN